MYTVTFQDQSQVEQISRFFETIKAARKWAKWLAGKPFVSLVSIYRGQAGEMLLERFEGVTPAKAAKFEGMSDVDGEQFAHYSGVVL
jgi:hypothetical protein